MITLRAQRALFSPDAGDLSSHAGNPVSHAPLMHTTRTLPADADAHVRDLFTGRQTTFDPGALVQDRLNSAHVPAIISSLTRPVRNQCARVHCKSSKVLPEWQHSATIAKSARVQSYAAVHDTAMSLLHIYVDANQSRDNSNFVASQFPVSFPTRWQHDKRFTAYSKSSNARLIDLQLPAMDSAADALLFLNAATGVFPPDIACEQLLAFPVIDVLIEGLTSSSRCRWLRVIT